MNPGASPRLGMVRRSCSASKFMYSGARPDLAWVYIATQVRISPPASRSHSGSGWSSEDASWEGSLLVPPGSGCCGEVVPPCESRVTPCEKEMLGWLAPTRLVFGEALCANEDRLAENPFGQRAWASVSSPGRKQARWSMR